MRRQGRQNFAYPACRKPLTSVEKSGEKKVSKVFFRMDLQRSQSRGFDGSEQMYDG